VEEKRPSAKGQLEEALPAIAMMLNDFLQHQRNSPVFHSLKDIVGILLIGERNRFFD